MTGCTGLTMPDRPFDDPRNHKPIMAKPNLNMAGAPRQPGQRPGHPLLPDQRQRHLLPAQAAAAGAAARCSTRTPCRPGRAGQGPAARPPDRRPGRQPGLPGLPRLEPVPVEPARHDDPVPGRRPVPPVHQRDHVPADPARRRPADHRRRPQLLPAGRSEEVGEERVPEQGHQAAARQPRRHAHPDRGRPAAAEPDADGRRDGAGRLDPCPISPPVLLGDPKFRGRTARCSTSTGACPSGSR